MFEFAEQTKEMRAREILNYYRNLYYAEPQVTERGITANAINDFFNEFFELVKQVAVNTRYRNKKYYLYDNCIFDENMNIVIENATNGFLDLYEYYEYFPQNKER